MLEGKSKKLEVPRDVKLIPLKNKMSKNKTKIMKKEPREMKKWKEWEMNERTMKNDLSRNDPWSDHPETQFGPTYPFFRNHSPSLHYVPEKSILIEHGYLDWRVFFLEKFFIINKAVVSFSQPTKNLDQSFTCSGWILNCQVHNRTVKKRKNDEKMKMEIKNMILGWKLERAV